MSNRQTVEASSNRFASLLSRLTRQVSLHDAKSLARYISYLGATSYIWLVVLTLLTEKG